MMLSILKVCVVAEFFAPQPTNFNQMVPELATDASGIAKVVERVVDDVLKSTLCPLASVQLPGADAPTAQ